MNIARATVMQVTVDNYPKRSRDLRSNMLTTFDNVRIDLNVLMTYIHLSAFHILLTYCVIVSVSRASLLVALSVIVGW